MIIADYCHNKGMTYEQYKQYELNIKSAAQAIKQVMLSLHKPDTGVYYDVLEVLPIILGQTISEQRNFIIKELKQIGVEFFDNNTLYRI